MNDAIRERWMNIVCLVAPVLTILLVQLVGMGPKSAVASSAGVGFVPLPSVPGGISIGEELELPSTIVSPFPEIDEQAKDMLPGFGGEARSLENPLEFVLSSVMPSGTRPLAVINGRLCRPGHALGGGWTLREIHASGRSVAIEHRSGRTKKLTLSTQGG